MLGPRLIGHNNQKSDIRFIRNVAAPKQLQPFKAQSAANIVYHQSSPLISSSNSLFISLTLPNDSTQSLVFNYSDQVKLKQLIEFLKNKIGSKNVYFKSNSLLLDYFLTLQGRLVAELNLPKLALQVCRIEIADRISLKQIQILKCIGSGGFSKVLLARVYGILMAIKIIDKQFVFRTAKQSIVQNQKTILQLCSGHPFITKMFFSFETNKFVVIGMQYCNGGELFNLLRKVKKMKQSNAKFYFIQTLMAIQHLHSQGILYRDLKPENIIIDQDGHVRLADFGLSKIINRSVTYSFCGSAEYMSPQMLLKKGHSYEVDYYCLGALLYELVTGLPPFYSQNQSQLFNGILNSQLTFPSHAIVSDELKFFLYKILQKQPQKRFQNIGQIINDPWVSHDFNREQVLAKKLIPPYPTENFNYNFDDSEFSFHQAALIKMIQLQNKSNQDPKLRSFNDFYYQSDEILQLKSQYELNNIKKLNFLKNKNSQKEQKHYTPSRQNSIHSHKPYIPHSNKKIELKEFQSKYQDLSATTSTIISPQNSMMHVRSAQNLKSLINIYTSGSHHHGQAINHNSSQKRGSVKNLNIYTMKPKFPASPLVKHRLSNNIYSRNQEKSIEVKMNNSFSKSKEHISIEWIKEHSNSLDKGYGQYKKPAFNGYNKNYLAEYRSKYSNPKVKKSSFRVGEKVNFHYGSLQR